MVQTVVNNFFCSFFIYIVVSKNLMLLLKHLKSNLFVEQQLLNLTSGTTAHFLMKILMSYGAHIVHIAHPIFEDEEFH